MDERRAPASPRRVSFGRDGQHRIELRTPQIAEGPRAPHDRVKLVFAVRPARRLRDNLLRQHVERRFLVDDRVELSLTYGAKQRRALNQIVTRRWENASLWHADDAMTRAADALQQRSDAMRRSDLAHQIHVPDVDAQLERRRGDERSQPTRLQPRLRVEPRLLGEAPMVRRDRLVAEAIAEVPRQPLRHPTGVDEHERRSVLGDERGQTVVVLLPDLVRHHRVERRPRQLDVEIHGTAMPFVDDDAAVRPAGEKSRDVANRLLRGRQADTLQRPLRDLLEPLDRQRQMRAPPRPDDGVYLVDDDGPDRSQHLSTAL